MKLIKSPLLKKKWRAIFDDGTHIDFGGAGYSDYTMHGDEIRKQSYLRRHHNENWNNYKTAGSLSRWILWNLPTVSASLTDYKRRFGLK